MGIVTAITKHAAAESLIDWWREAGVDTQIDEQPRIWLPSPATGAPPAASAPRDDTLSADVPRAPKLPANLSDFLNWLTTDTSVLGDFPKRRRLAPSGDPDSDLMVIADMPERGDVENGRLFSSDGGVLLDKMLQALQRNRDTIYFTTLAPTRSASGRLDEQDIARLSPLLTHLIALVAPKMLWLLGDAVSRAVLGTDVGAAAGRLHVVNQAGCTIHAIATLHPQVLLREPRLKANVWKDMQMLLKTVKS